MDESPPDPIYGSPLRELIFLGTLFLLLIPSYLFRQPDLYGWAQQTTQIFIATTSAELLAPNPLPNILYFLYLTTMLLTLGLFAIGLTQLFYPFNTTNPLFSFITDKPINPSSYFMAGTTFVIFLITIYAFGPPNTAVLLFIAALFLQSILIGLLMDLAVGHQSDGFNTIALLIITALLGGLLAPALTGRTSPLFIYLSLLIPSSLFTMILTNLSPETQKTWSDGAWGLFLFIWPITIIALIVIAYIELANAEPMSLNDWVTLIEGYLFSD